MIPPRVKLAGIYINSILAKSDAVLSGFDEAILLNQDGHVCEGSGENIFVIKDGTISTPSLDSNVLPGITRDTVKTLIQQELEGFLNVVSNGTGEGVRFQIRLPSEKLFKKIDFKEE